MMIWKQEIPIEGSFSLQLPRDAQILCVQTQEGKPCIWFSFEKPEPREPRAFVLGTTGPEIDFDKRVYSYVGTFQLNGGKFIGHLFAA